MFWYFVGIAFVSFWMGFFFAAVMSSADKADRKMGLK